MTEIIASKATLYRKLSNDGRAFIHCSHRKPPSSSSSSSDAYYVPKWNVFANTKHKIFAHKSVILKVYKDDRYASNIDLVDLLLAPLPKVYLVFGRDEKECDFCVQHLSISRKHCIFYFNRNGHVYLFDISTHGVLINDAPVPKRKHVQLKHEDRIQFGQSSRCYVVCVGDKPVPHHRDDQENMTVTANRHVDDKTDKKLKKTELEKQKLQLENTKQSVKINEMQKMIEKLTLELTQSKQRKNVQSEDEKHDDDGDKNDGNGNSDSENGNESDDDDDDDDEEEDTEEEEEEQDENDEDSEEHEHDAKNVRRVTKINGVDFLKERNHLSKLTVVKLRYYIDKNKINVGRVKKAELINVITNDLKKHFRA
eukprot:CAMPEP_0202687776 /NCGR_PEP_ID=MMETSP1385-20130828/3395_1 /ASSEMBLY_ACC=CAM_ASM_000861 /TAXON_ID=933848 /ORGANISM="Elphidium margaritaceum" /LENGTH=367 /DNA_ID=CAMNT_0049342619 /DNA_START=215 /DNA_END=1318 /DNA_ORIENTATION=-